MYRFVRASPKVGGTLDSTGRAIETLNPQALQPTFGRLQPRGDIFREEMIWQEKKWKRATPYQS
jgi:hypothetical protein